MSHHNKTNDERTQAIALANRLLDEPNCDPDDDLRVLARWFLRRHETANNHRQTLIGIADMDPATEADRMLLWAKDALSGYVETAEVSQKKQQDEINRLRAALQTIAEGRGPFSTDQLTFATAVIETMKQTATEALTALRETP